MDKSGSLSTAWTEQQGQVNRVTNQPIQSTINHREPPKGLQLNSTYLNTPLRQEQES